MLKFLLEGKDGRKLVAMGLTDGNIERLKKGEPIMFDLAEILPGTKNTEALIYWGTDMVDLKQQAVDKMGLKFPPETEK
jgi:hypothetical protein